MADNILYFPQTRADSMFMATDALAETARDHGRVLGLSAAIKILSKHGIDPFHPARQEIFTLLMNVGEQVAKAEGGA